MPTTFKGFGVCSVGTSGFGYGEPATIDAVRRKPFVKADGTQGTARKIDTETGDYILDPVTGQFVGMDVTEQMVYLALVTVKGTSVIRGLGQSFANIKTIGNNLQTQIENQVNEALQELIKAGQVTVEDVEVTVEQATRRPTVTVRWRDVSSDTLKETSV